jgi:hypothetical protein
MVSLFNPFRIFATILLLLSITTPVRAQWGTSCNICKSGDEIRNPDAIIVVVRVFGFPYFQTCEWVDKRFTIGMPYHTCKWAQANKTWQRKCGCDA